MIEFAERIEQDIPAACVWMEREVNASTFADESVFNLVTGKAVSKNNPKGIVDWKAGSCDLLPKQDGKHSDELFLQAFKQRVISAFG